MFTPKNIDLIIYQGATFKKTWAISKESDGSPYNLTNWKGRMQIRPKKSSDVVLADLTTENGGIIIDITPELSKYSIYISSIQTSNLLTKGVYDLEFIDPQGEVIRIQEGIVTISLGVTKE